MRSERISNSATVYIYDDIEDYSTNVFLIEKETKFYLIDTYCGTGSMKPIINIIKNNPRQKEVNVINTHFHWDHIWGNCCFKDNCIISHEICRDLIDKYWEDQLKENKQYIIGTTEKQLPNFTFKKQIFFHYDGIELFYSPGHTVDSISIFDHEDKILYVGDNLEKPIVYVEHHDIPTYINTLKSYLSYHPQKIIASHTLNIKKEDIFDTIKYLEGLLAGKEMFFASDYTRKVHSQNLRTIQNHN